MVDRPPGNFGPEFYAGRASAVADACSSGDWDALRSGRLTTGHVVFPSCVHSLDILLLPEVVSVVAGKPMLALSNNFVTVAGIEGLWGARVLPRDWVAAVAAIPPNSARDLQIEWMRIHNREYEPEPDFAIPAWSSKEVLKATTALLSLVHTADKDGHDVVEIWSL